MPDVVRGVSAIFGEKASAVGTKTSVPWPSDDSEWWFVWRALLEEAVTEAGESPSNEPGEEVGSVDLLCLWVLVVVASGLTSSADALSLAWSVALSVCEDETTRPRPQATASPLG